MENLQKIIQEAWSNRELVKQTNTQDAIRAVIEEVDKGRIRVASPVEPSPSISNLVGCAPLQVVFNSGLASGEGRWLMGDGSADQAGLYAAHVFTATGVYTVNFKYSSPEGCSANTQTLAEIRVKPQPKPDFSVPHEVWLSSPEIQTVNRTQNLAQYTYTWTVSNGVEANPINLAFIANRIGRYEITLTARSVEGCTAAVSKLVDVKNDFTVWVPNSFTPNDDGLNDQFRPVFSEYGLNSAGYRMEIFDRWGQSLFWTTDPQKGWNGQVKSELCKEGSYVYKIKYATLDGQVFDRIGYVLLLRN